MIRADNVADVLCMICPDQFEEFLQSLPADTVRAIQEGVVESPATQGPAFTEDASRALAEAVWNYLEGETGPHA